MKAMILAAGLGTRLRTLTDNRPKALVELSGRTLLEITLTRLRTFGVTEVIVNVHHFADMVTDYLKSHKNFGLRIEISREEVLLDTGGGLKKTAWFFLEDPSRLDEPFVLHNVDVISTIDLRAMLQFHSENHALATLAVQSRETSRPLLFDDNHQLRGRRIHGKDTLIPILPNTVISSEARPLPLCASPAQRNLSSSQSRDASPSPETTNNCHSGRSEESSFSSDSPLATRHSPLPLAFSGIHIISPRLLPMLTEEGIFSIIPSYLRLSAEGQKILAFRADQYYWRDLGRPADLAQAAQDLQQNV
jgi:NDP-sugar pyrophosphorylase family protein